MACPWSKCWLTGLATLADELDAVHLFDLPAESTIYRVFKLPGSLDLVRSLGSVIAGLLRESADVRDVAARVEGQLREVTSTSWS